jgi:ribokinase
MSPSVVVVGSLHYDMIVSSTRLPLIGETLPGTGWASKCGGKGGNQAVEAARHGAAVHMVACVGADEFGRKLLDNLRLSKVDTTHVSTVDAGSGLSVVVSEAGGDYAAVIVSGANQSLSARELAGAKAVIGDAAVLILQNEIPEQVSLAAARLARSGGARIILNAAPARHLPAELASLVDLIIVNAIEAEMLGAEPVADLKSAAHAAEFLSGRGPEVIVTAGGHGVAVRSGDYVATLEPHPIDLVSTHGAGDAFVGALAARLAAGDKLADAVAYANAAAAVLVSTKDEGRRGLTSADVHELLAKRPGCDKVAGVRGAGSA